MNKQSKPGRKPGTPKTGGRTKSLPEGATPRIYKVHPDDHPKLRSLADQLNAKRKPSK